MSRTSRPTEFVRGRLGLWSLLLPVGAIALAFVSVRVFAAVTGDTPDPALTTSSVLVLAALAAVPVCQVVGLGIGIAALFRGEAPRWPAITGVVINGLFVLALVVFVWGYLGASR